MNNSSRFYSSLGLLILLNAVIKPLWILGIDRQVQNVVGLEAYGVYFSLFNLSVVFSFLTDWGFTTFFNQQLSINEEKVSRHIGNFLLLKIFFSLIYIVAVFIAAWFSGVAQWDILVYITLIQVWNSLFLFLRAIITSRQWFRTEAWISVADKSLMILICGFFLYIPSGFGAITIKQFLLFQNLCFIIAILIAFIFLYNKKISFAISKKWIPGREVILKMLPFAMIFLVMSLHARLDAFLLERIHPDGAYEAGIYAAGYRLLDAANIACYLIMSFTLPYMARQWSKKETITSTVLNCRHLLLMFSIGVASIFFFMGDWVQQLLYHHDDAVAVKVLQWCLPVLIAYSLTHVYGTALTATGNVMPFLYIVLAAVIVNIILNLLLIPSMGALGCCIAALCSQFFCGIFLLIYVSVKLKLSPDIRSLLIYIFTAGLLCLFFYFFNESTFPRWLLIAGAAMMVVVIMLVSRMVGIAQWFYTIKYRQ